MFLGHNVIGYFNSRTDSNGTPNNAQRRACDMARVVTTCKFLNDGYVEAGMRETVSGIESVLYVFYSSTSLSYISLSRRYKILTLGREVMDKNVPHPKFKYKDEHQEFFKELFDKGIKNARERLQKYAEWMTKKDKDGLAKLTQAAQQDIRRIKDLKPSSGKDDAWNDFCPSYNW